MSPTPYYLEVRVLAATLVTAAILIILANYLALKFPPSTKRWQLWLITIPVAVFYLAVYLYASDIGGLATFASLVAGVVFGSVTVFGFIFRGERFERTAEAPGAGLTVGQAAIRW